MVRTEQKLKSHNNQLITIHNKKQSQKIKIKKPKQERKRARTEQNKQTKGREITREKDRKNKTREKGRLPTVQAGSAAAVGHRGRCEFSQERKGGKASFSPDTKEKE
jgi:hypothetical protein